MAKTVSTRIQHKREFETNWLDATGFVPLEGELVVYLSETDPKTGATLTTTKGGQNVSVLTDTGRTVPYGYPRFKIGDGKTHVKDLPFQGVGAPLMVTLSDDETIASHTPKEILEHVNAGGKVYLQLSPEDAEYKYYNSLADIYYDPAYEEDSTAIFRDDGTDENYLGSYTIHSDRSVERYEHWFCTADYAKQLASERFLTVTLNASTRLASHTAQQIRTHIQDGGDAVLCINQEYLKLVSLTSEVALFFGTQGSCYVIHNDGTYSEWRQEYITQSYLNNTLQDIDEAIAEKSGLKTEQQGEIFNDYENNEANQNSAAFGQATAAKGTNQFVIGKFNEKDAYSKYVFIAGNGAEDTKRGNAATISWDGELELAGSVTAPSAKLDTLSIGTYNDTAAVTVDADGNISTNTYATADFYNVSAYDVSAGQAEIVKLEASNLAIGKDENNNPKFSVDASGNVFSSGNIEASKAVFNELTANSFSGALTLSGYNINAYGSVTSDGSISAGTNVISGSEPYEDNHCATKKYVDKHSAGIIDVAALPTANINDKAIYRVIKASDYYVSQDYAYTQPDAVSVVNELPATAVDYQFYYCLSDSKVYGYLNERTYDEADPWMSQWEGWHEAADVIGRWGWGGECFAGVTTDISNIDVHDERNWDTHFIYLQHELYHYAGGRFVKIYDSGTGALQAHILPRSRPGDNYGCDVSAAVMHEVISSGGTVILNDLDGNKYLPQSEFESYVVFNAISDDVIFTHWEIWDHADGKTSAAVTEKQLVAYEYMRDYVSENRTKVQINIWEDDD